MTTKLALNAHNLFSIASRKRCIDNLKAVRVPRFKSNPSATASVLVPFCSNNDVVSILYTVRSAKLRTNSGQVAFPGGKTDEGETPEQTALRETEEEIGLSTQKVEVWGHSPAIPGQSNRIMITPVIGSITDLFIDELKVNHDEVSDVFCVPLEVLCDPSRQFHTQFANGFILPVFLTDKYRIWGVTAYITHVVLSCLLTRDVYKNDWTRKKVTLNDLKSI